MANAGVESNPLLQDFEFPPYDTIEPRHIRPAIDYLLKKLEDDLEELERTAEPSWSRLVEPFEKIVDRWTVVWGMVDHLLAVKYTAELRAARDEVEAEKVKFDLRLEQSEPIHNAFKALRESLDNRPTKRLEESPDWKSQFSKVDPDLTPKPRCNLPGNDGLVESLDLRVCATRGTPMDGHMICKDDTVHILLETVN